MQVERLTIQSHAKFAKFALNKHYLGPQFEQQSSPKCKTKNPAKRRSALNLQLCIDYYIPNHLNTNLNTHHNTPINTHQNAHHNPHLNTHPNTNLIIHHNKNHNTHYNT